LPNTLSGRPVVWEDGGGDPASYPIGKIIILLLTFAIVGPYILRHEKNTTSRSGMPAFIGYGGARGPGK
jgi:hypothetical protein